MFFEIVKYFLKYLWLSAFQKDQGLIRMFLKPCQNSQDTTIHWKIFNWPTSKYETQILISRPLFLQESWCIVQ